MTHKVFVSYAQSDKVVADQVCAGLEAAGLTCWMAPRDIMPAQEWGAAIIDAIEAARVMVVVFSSAANASKHVYREVERAVAKGVAIVPLRIEAVPVGKQLEYFLSSHHWLDAIAPPLDDHIQVLANAVRSLLSTPTESPDPKVERDSPAHEPEPDDATEADFELASRGRWARVQARLLDQKAVTDYAWLALMGAAPLGLSIALGAFHDMPLPPTSPVFASCRAALGRLPIVEGYGSRLNWWPYFALLPFVVYVLRHMAAQLFPLSGSRDFATRGILKKIPPQGRKVVAQRLANVALDPRNLKVVVAVMAVINIIDLRETAAYYLSALTGDALTCPREFDWTVHFFAGASVSLEENVLLLLIAYPCQFLLHALALMLFGLLLRHNLFYLSRIYQRHRSHRSPLSERIVLDFEDVERCFGLRPLHSVFNYQVILLITGGLTILSSRLMNVDVTPLGVQYERLLSRLLQSSTTAVVAPVAIGFGDLFPDAGQVMLGAAWVTCFVIVAIPSAVKFLPLIYKHVRIVGRREYLLEFIPAETVVRLNTPQEVDAVALKFSRSSFWPAGDERARTLYTMAYFVFFIVIIPTPPTSRPALAVHLVLVFVLSYVLMKVTFWLYRKALVNIDATLAQD